MNQSSGSGLTRVALVSVLLQIALGKLEVLLWDDLVEGEGSSAHELASTAMA